MKISKVFAMLLILLLCCSAAVSETEYSIVAEAALYDACVDIDISADEGRDQAKAVFSAMWQEFGGSGDVVFRLCTDASGVPGVGLIAEWESVYAVIVWYVPGAVPDIESWQPTEDVSVADDGENYVLNINTEKFHYPDCTSVSDILEKNRKDYHGTRDEVIDMGYDPCGRCKP